jgi:ribosomal protein L12E/L44/L45/RPP1/RPP2
MVEQVQPKQKRAKRTSWKSDDWDEMVRIGAELYVEGLAITEPEAFRMANDRMPEEGRIGRGNSKLYPSNYPNWVSRWEEAVTRVRLDKIQKLQEPEAEPVAVPEPAVVKATTEQWPFPEPAVAPAAPAPQPVPVAADSVAKMAAETITTVALAAVQQVGVTFVEKLINVFLTALETPRGQEAIRNAFHVPAGVPVAPAEPANISPAVQRTPGIAPTAPVVKRQRKILIVGLRGDQEQIIKTAYKDKFDLRFLTQEATSKMMRENSANVDTTYGMVGFMHHSVDGTLNKVAKEYKRVNGTLGELKRMLDIALRS